MKTDKNMKKAILTLALVLAVTTAGAQASRQETKENRLLMGSNYLAYPGPKQEQLTATPKGYEPYYLSHYGRHGSRHLIENSDYDKAYKTLLRGDSLGKLTPLGKEVLQRVALLRSDAEKRHGELTLLGAQQHQQIGARMYERFPEVFAGKAPIDAKSTVVIRCILSMENALHALLRKNPELDIRHDASEHDMWYMNFRDKELDKRKMPDALQKTFDEFCLRHQHNDRLMNTLFNDNNYWKNEVNAQELAYHLFKLGSNIPMATNQCLVVYPLWAMPPQRRPLPLQPAQPATRDDCRSRQLSAPRPPRCNTPIWARGVRDAPRLLA